MSDRLELLCAELRAIDYFEWHYRRATRTNDADVLSHELRLERRERIVSEIQVMFERTRGGAAKKPPAELPQGSRRWQ